LRDRTGELAYLFRLAFGSGMAGDDRVSPWVRAGPLGCLPECLGREAV